MLLFMLQALEMLSPLMPSFAAADAGMRIQEYCLRHDADARAKIIFSAIATLARCYAIDIVCLPAMSFDAAL